MNIYLIVLKESLKEFGSTGGNMNSFMELLKECLKEIDIKEDFLDKFGEGMKKEQKRIPFFFFDKRKQLENCFYKWCEENDALKSPFNVITFLAEKDMLNIDKVIDYLEEAQDEDILYNT